MKPNYKQLYFDIIIERFSEKMNDDNIRNKIENLNNSIDILVVNRLIFGEKQQETQVNQKLHSYDKNSILAILQYQKKNNLSNVQTAKHFKISRNSIAKWKLSVKKLEKLYITE